MRCTPWIFALAGMLVLIGCGTPPAATYRYTAAVTTGIGHQIVVDGKEEPVVFSEKSDPMARWSLCHLKSEVLHAAGNEITVTGSIEKRVPKAPRQPPVHLSNGQTAEFADPEAHLLFRITGWKLKAPFHEYHVGFDTDITRPFPLKTRHTLRRDDFTSSREFDPRQPAFDPARHVQGE